MKTIATIISAATLAAASGAASAWGPYGYAPYGYAPYGFAPVQPAGELTEEQKQAMADQQARMIEQMQAAQKQAAEFYANNPHPMFELERTFIEDRNASILEMQEFMREMHEMMARDIRDSMQFRPYEYDYDYESDYERPARFQDRETFREEMKARIEENRKAAEQRRQEARERFEARKQERATHQHDVTVDTDQVGA